MRNTLDHGACAVLRIAGAAAMLLCVSFAGRGETSHWAFQPIRSPAPPQVRQADWPGNAIDRFVLARLEAEGLEPSPEADRRTLIRRAYLTLLGLPPTADEISAFENDPNPGAWRRLIERLLASPRYGERWARHWLDLARYADNKGYVLFQRKDYPWAYTYRDYVIESFNRDLPFDRFVMEQLAADQLVGDDKTPLRALGFLTVGPRFSNDIHNIIDDRIDVVTRGLLGLTVSCARCHDHKFDPVSQEDYYALYGVFRSSEEPLLPPEFAPAPDNEAHAAFEKEMRKRLGELHEFMATKRREISLDARKRAAGYLMTVHNRRNDPDAGQFTLLAGKGDLNPTVVLRWEVYLEQARKNADPVWTPWHALSEIPESEFADRAEAVLQRMASRNQEDGQANPLVLKSLQAAKLKSMDDAAAAYSKVLNEAAEEWAAIVAAADETGTPTPDGLEDPDREALREVFTRADSPANVATDVSRGFRELLPDRPTQAEFRKLLTAVEKWSSDGKGAPPRAMTIEDAGKLYDPRVFIRGNFNRPGEPVERRFLSAISPRAKPFEKGSGRLELAEAIVAPGNPLAARVMANRIWQHHFGRGLVATPSDFGSQGEPPTHPELLDHLASEFRAHGWSIKRLHREILLSATWRQESADRVEARRIDPENRLLWRMNRRRLGFEGVRDSLIAAAGELRNRIGGPSVRVDTSEWEPRRTVYAHVDRMNIPNVMRCFDFPTPVTSAPGRSETTVAPQALYLMNHEFAAQAAGRVLKRPEIAKAGSASERIEEIYRAVYARQPAAEELEMARKFVAGAETDSSESPWTYGYGAIDEAAQRLQSFAELKHWTGSRWQAGPKRPDSKLGWLTLEATGGHPDTKNAIIRRWTAPRDLTVSVEGRLRHSVDKGDGVRARILVAGRGFVGEWTAENSATDTKVDVISVPAGDTIDFVVDMRKTISHDQHDWAVRIVEGLNGGGDAGAVWDSVEEFAGRESHAWHRFVHALLMTNEFVFVD